MILKDDDFNDEYKILIDSVGKEKGWPSRVKCL